MSFFFTPSIPEELLESTSCKMEGDFFKQRYRLLVISSGYSEFASHVEAVPLDRKQDKLRVLNKAKESSSHPEWFSLYFIVREKVFFVTKEGKEIFVEDKTENEEVRYLFDDQFEKNNFKILPAGELPNFIDVSNWDKEVAKKIEENPEKICLLGRSRIDWLNKYVLVSELKECETDSVF